MTENLYRKAEKEAKKVAEICKIDNGWEIRKITCEHLKELMVEEAKTIVDSLNIMGGDVQEAVLEGMLEGINKSHRSLQGEFWGVMLKLIKKYGESKYFDPRNEWAVKMCRRMAIAGEDPRTKEVLESHIEATKF